MSLPSAILQHYVRPRVKSSTKFGEDAIPLLAATGADVAEIWEVSLDANQAIPIAGYAHNGAAWMPNSNAREVVHERTRPEFFIKLVHGDVLCSPVAPGEPLFRAEYNAGLRHLCGIGVPTVFGHPCQDSCMSAGSETPTRDAEYNASVVLQSEADKILN